MDSSIFSFNVYSRESNLALRITRKTVRRTIDVGPLLCTQIVRSSSLRLM